MGRDDLMNLNYEVMMTIFLLEPQLATMLFAISASLLSIAAPPYTNGACIPMDVVFDVDSGSAIKTWSGVGDAGACCRLCTSTWGCAAFSAFAHTETQAASCVLFADTSHQVVGVNNVTSARVIKTPTHYLDPQKGPCASDETIRGWLSKGGTGPALQLCSQECDPKAAFPCPLDIPDGAIGSPKCDLNGNAFPDLFCALNCTVDSDCGVGGFCDYAESHSLCGYLANSSAPTHGPWTLATPVYEKCLTIGNDKDVQLAFNAATVSFAGYDFTTGKPLATWGSGSALAIATNEPVVCAEVCRNNNFEYMALANNDAVPNGDKCFCTKGLPETTFAKDPYVPLTSPLPHVHTHLTKHLPPICSWIP